MDSDYYFVRAGSDTGCGVFQDEWNVASTYTPLESKEEYSQRRIKETLKDSECWFGNEETTNIDSLPARVRLVHLESCKEIKSLPTFIENKSGKLIFFYSNQSVRKVILNWRFFKVLEDDTDDFKIVVTLIEDNLAFMEGL